MNVDEIDKLFPLIVMDNKKELYPLVRNIKELHQDNPLIYKTIADRFAKNDQLDTIRLKFLRRINDKSKDDVPKFYSYFMAKFYLNVISLHKNRSIVLKLLNLLHQDQISNLSQIVSKITSQNYVFPSQLIYWLGKLLIRLNLNIPPVPSEYVKLTDSYLNPINMSANDNDNHVISFKQKSIISTTSQL